ncbi:MAG: CHAP domain-containing protein [Ruminococcus sp.]|nr:CHAP domain-containing protein [Ruminococcus sp.]
MKSLFRRFTASFLVLMLLFASVCFTATAAADEFPNTHINTGNQRIDIIEIAKTQVGFREGPHNDTKYGSWYGLPNQPWCAMFVSWCARQAGIPTDILRNCAVAAPDYGYFDIPYYDGEEYTPQTGDLFFTKTFSHVGLVYYVDGEYCYTIEGNTNIDGSNEGIGVFIRTRKISDYYFGVPDYNYKSQQTHQCDKSSCISVESAHPHYSNYLCSVCKAITPDYSSFNYADKCIDCAKNHHRGYVGDCDGDRIVTIKDATAIQKHIAQVALIPDNYLGFADADTDTVLTIKDATAIQKHIAGIDTGYPIGVAVT